jgi:hypothetical protein
VDESAKLCANKVSMGRSKAAAVSDRCTICARPRSCPPTSSRPPESDPRFSALLPLARAPSGGQGRGVRWSSFRRPFLSAGRSRCPWFRASSVAHNASTRASRAFAVSVSIVSLSVVYHGYELRIVVQGVALVRGSRLAKERAPGREHRSWGMKDRRGAAMMSSFGIRLRSVPTSEGATELGRPCSTSDHHHSSFVRLDRSTACFLRCVPT